MDSALKEKYQIAVADLRRKIIDERSSAYDKYDTGRVSASLFHLRPDISIAQHPDILPQIYFNQCCAHADQYHLDLLVPNVSAQGDGMATLFGGQPSIVCAFHYGAFRLVLPFALSRGLKISMLIDHRVAEAQGKDFKNILQQFCSDRNLPETNVRIRDTANASMLLSLVRDIRAGYTVLVFLDGNIGAGQDVNPNVHAVPVDFLGATLHSRMGVAILSYLTQCPIIPVLTPRVPDCLWATQFQAHAPILPNDTERDAYVGSACAAMWAPLEQAVRKDLLPWESWRYVDRSLDIQELQARHCPVPEAVESGVVLFNDRRFVLADDYNEPILFDRAAYRVHTITPTLFKLLRQFVGTPHSKQYALAQPRMSPATLKQLVDAGVLHSPPN